MSTPKPATPLPWHVGMKQAEQIVYDATGWAVANATVYHGKAELPETKANAAYIVAAANAYPRLVEALRGTLGKLAAYIDTQGDPQYIYAAEKHHDDVLALLRELGEDAS